MIKVLIVDDEPLARKRIKRMLASVAADFVVVGESAGVDESVRAVGELQPDLIFLDVQMPDGDGFDVIKKIDSKLLPAVVFVTAYDQFTLQAFDVYALDYLLKPFSEDRFRNCVERVRENLPQEAESYNRQILNLLNHLKLNQNYLERITVNHNNRLIIVPTKEIEWIAAYGNYLRIFHKGKVYLTRETINSIAEQLNPQQFVRIHRSTLVSIDSIKEFQPMFGGQYTVVMRDGTEFSLSRNYRKKVLSMFEKQ